MVFRGLIDVASLLVFITYYDKLRSETDVLSSSIVRLKEDGPMIERVLEILHKNTSSAGRQAAGRKGVLEVQGVSFGYKMEKKHSMEEEHSMEIGHSMEEGFSTEEGHSIEKGLSMEENIPCDISFRVPEKKHIVIVGKSGCGKTTGDLGDVRKGKKQGDIRSYAV